MTLHTPQKTAPNLPALLRERFGFREFRPYQERVCEAVAGGADALLVMPTGAGKSLCYQLPGIARGGTTLVVSPLIALMEDQAEKLGQQGFLAERIHSGRPRAESNEVCRQYLRGELDFLFIAPERLAVPGFPELLARRLPALIAVDEAHCISHWGHDFRPEYRLLGERLPMLRPAPVIAMTATATKAVQKDIVLQLRLNEPQLFIHGFRRTNIAIELIESPPNARNELVAGLLSEPARLPAIVYAPTRAKAAELGQLLAKTLPAATYHAGLSAKGRDEVQAGFLSGKLSVIVATIAFGMGIDKADVRTVIHCAMPATVEGYYQEIGRAGRDGKNSRAILLHSQADRHLHEFFMGKSYPESTVLAELYKALPKEFTERETLRARSTLKEEEFDAALEKLWIHGGARLDFEDRVCRGDTIWSAPYETQRRYKADQLESMLGFVRGQSCRMKALLAHFGDKSDDGRACGLCDICAPKEMIGGQARDPNGQEEKVLQAILFRLRERESLTAGQLFTDLGEPNGLSRREFEPLLDALARASLISLSEESFMKEGRRIHFRRATLTHEGEYADREQLDTLRIFGSLDKPQKKGVKAKSRVILRKAAEDEAQENINRGLYEALREWRLACAKRHRAPAFHVLSDRTLLELAAEQPTTPEELLEVHGIGPTKAKKYGTAILKVIRKARAC